MGVCRIPPSERYDHPPRIGRHKEGTVRCSVLTEHRTRGVLGSVDTEALLVDALAQVGVQARTTTGAPDQENDLVLDPGGVEIQVKHRALVTGEVARRLLGETPLPDRVVRVVADRVTEDASAVLTGHHAGYFELRGHLAIRSATIVIDVDEEPVPGRAERTNALNGSVGLEVATALLGSLSKGARGETRRLVSQAMCPQTGGGELPTASLLLRTGRRPILWRHSIGRGPQSPVLRSCHHPVPRGAVVTPCLASRASIRLWPICRQVRGRSADTYARDLPVPQWPICR